ncbi:hypothetical protein GCM10010384_68370 [Streptomyces djakartensis]|uniref:Uncharacterized protein n=1 Tax=Streptomyces djakartensis TaxID=68193 RepID=A0ABQ3AI46_9ACTN|nr:hypothetical protein GCM10010384_68370 [Streptomyces djakartensis]
MPYAGLRPEAGPARKTTQHRAISEYVTGADDLLADPPPRTIDALHFLITNTEHDVTGRNSADRLAAVDAWATRTRQAVGLRTTRTGEAGGVTDTRRKENRSR